MAEEEKRQYHPPVYLYTIDPEPGALVKQWDTGDTIPEEQWGKNTKVYSADGVTPLTFGDIDKMFGNGLWAMGKTNNGHYIIKQVADDNATPEEKATIDSENKWKEGMVDFDRALASAYEKMGLTEEKLKELEGWQVQEWRAPYHQFNSTNYPERFAPVEQPNLDMQRRAMIRNKEADDWVNENFGGKAWAKVGGLMLGGAAAAGGLASISPWLFPAINTILTPSTYTTLLGMPTWAGTTANLATSGYFAVDALGNIIENPRNGWNYLQLLGSAIPFSRYGTRADVPGKYIAKGVEKVSPTAASKYKSNLFDNQLLADGTSLNSVGSLVKPITVDDLKIINVGEQANNFTPLSDNVAQFGNEVQIRPFGYAPEDDAVDLFKSRVKHRFNDIQKEQMDIYNNLSPEEKHLIDTYTAGITAPNDPKSRLSPAYTLSKEEQDKLYSLLMSGKGNVYFTSPKAKKALENVGIYYDKNIHPKKVAAVVHYPSFSTIKYNLPQPAVLQDYPTIFAHELNHLIYRPTEVIPTNVYQLGKNGHYLFVLNNGTESSARGTQLKNYFGISDDAEITPQMWEYAKKNYVKDTGYDNHMTEWFNSVIDVPAFLKWLNKHSLIVTGAAGVGAAASGNSN